MTLAETISKHVSALPPEKQREVLDFVLFLQQRREEVIRESSDDGEKRRRRVAAAFDALRRSGAFADIADPVKWQRDIRKDRPLPGREESA